MEIMSGIEDHLHLKSPGKMAVEAIEAIRINSLTVESRGGRPVLAKRRGAVARPVAMVANLFFRLAGAPISVFADPEKWQRWEVNCFHLLNGNRLRAFAEDRRTVCTDILPGKNLREIIAQGELTPHILEVSAHELRRAHSLYCDQLGGTWSHGDLQLSNVIYNAATDRAQLVDFEIMHDPSLPAVARHADDLLVFLQDLLERIPARQWVPLATAFINAYGQPEVTAELRKKLIIPHGVAGLWWKIRADQFNRSKLALRTEELRKALDLPAATAARRRAIKGKIVKTRSPASLAS